MQSISLEITLTKKQAERIADFLMDIAKGLLLAMYGTRVLVNVLSVISFLGSIFLVLVCVYLSLEITKEFL